MFFGKYVPLPKIPFSGTKDKEENMKTYEIELDEYGENFDWLYDEIKETTVRIEAEDTRHADELLHEKYQIVQDDYDYIKEVM